MFSKCFIQLQAFSMQGRWSRSEELLKNRKEFACVMDLGGYRGTAIVAVGLDRQIIGAKDYFSGIGLAIMPRDRFVAIVPDPAIGLRNSLKLTRETVGKEVRKPVKPNTIGQVTLRPLDLSEVRRITLNADASKGRIAVEVLNEEGFRIRGFSKDDCIPLTGDSLAADIAWKDRTL